MTRKKNVLPQQQTAPLGPSTDDLKGRFRAQSLPLDTDFAMLIDVADCGRRATGQSPDFTPENDSGLALSNDGQLKMVPKPDNGISVTDAGVGLVVDTTAGLVVDINGIGLANDRRFVKGMIMIFNGTSAPNGWAICDGQVVNGFETPNLTNRFIMGGKGSDVGLSGGALITGEGRSKVYSVDTNAVSSGNIDVIDDGHALTIEEMPRHEHKAGVGYTTEGDNDLEAAFPYGTHSGTIPIYNQEEAHGALDLDHQAWDNTRSGYTSDEGLGLPHTHTASGIQSTHQHTITMLPAYYTYIYIIKL